MTSYVEGRWLALVTARSVAVFADAPAASLPALADAIEARGLAGFIDALTEATETTVWSLPEFAVAIAEEQGIRVAARGTLTLTDASGGHATALTGVGVTGWSEAIWEASAAVVIDSGDGPRGGELWVVEGAVRAASVRWNPSAPRAIQSPALPAPHASPEQPRPLASVPDVAPTPPDVLAEASAPLSSAATAGTEPQDAAVRDSEISLETLAPAYDEEADGQAEASHDTVFGSLWGSTVSAPPAGSQPGPGALISVLPEFTSPPPPPPGEESGPGALASPPAPPAPPAPPIAPSPGQAHDAPRPVAQPAGDHDGATVSVAALRAMTSGRAPATSDDASMPSFATAEQLAKEGRGRAVVSNGVVVTLDKSVIVGRTPRASRVTGEMPHLVTVPSPTQDISRSHVELRVEGTAVVAVDLNTTNGTLVKRKGAPQRRRP